MQHYLKQKDRLIKLAALRRFLANRVQPGLAIAAQFQANKAMTNATGKPVTLTDVVALTMLPQALQRKIQVELSAKHLRHPFLRCWFGLDQMGAEALCYNAIDFVGLAADDHLFFPRASAAGAYVMTMGTSMYLCETDGNSDKGSDKWEMEIYQGRFFCEAALWCKWKHVGELTAMIACELLAISTSGLFKCLDQDLVVKHVVIQYGRSFHARLTAPLLPEGQQPNDISVAFTDFDSMLPSLPMQCRQLIGAVAVSTAKQRRDWKAWNSRDVREGRSCLMVNWAGEVERIVSVIVLRLARPDGRVLVQLGERKSHRDETQASCRLPGKKQEEGETPRCTIARLLQGPLAPFANAVVCTSARLEVTWMESKRMRVPTKYLRTVNYADVDETVDAFDSIETVFVPQGVREQGSISGVTRVNSLSMFSSSSKASSSDIDSVYVLADEAGDITFVSWLNVEEMGFFTSSRGEGRLQEIMDSLVLDPDLVEAAKERFEACRAIEVLEQTHV